MAYEERRALVRIGHSQGVVLPRPWLRFHGERANKLTLFADDVLVIAPQGFEAKAKRLLTSTEIG